MPLKKKLKANDKNQNDAVHEEDVEEVSSGDDESMSDSENDASECDEQEEGDVDPNEEVMIDFEARELEESDLNTISLLAEQKLGLFQTGVSAHDVAKYLIQQEKIGNVIYQAEALDDDEEEKEKESDENEEDTTIFGVLSIIDLQSNKAQNISNKLRSFLTKECQTADKANLTSLLSNKRISYIVNERFINIPPAISIPMFESLLKDLDSSTSSIQYDYWLFLSKVYANDDEAANKCQQENMYANPEEEVFEEYSEFKFDIVSKNKTPKSTSGKWSKEDAVLLPQLKVFFLSREKINDAINKIKSLIK